MVSETLAGPDAATSANGPACLRRGLRHLVLRAVPPRLRVVARCIDELVEKGAADDEPFRTVLKMARGGVIEEIKKEPQAEGWKRRMRGKLPEPPPLTPPPPTHKHRRQGGEPDAGASEPDALASFNEIRRRHGPVLRRRDGRLTYIASDVAYHKDKLTDESGQEGPAPWTSSSRFLAPIITAIFTAYKPCWPPC